MRGSSSGAYCATTSSAILGIRVGNIGNDVDGAACEIDAEVEALGEEDNDAQQHRGRGDCEPHAALGDDRVRALA